jgi:hypothetical protein
VLPCTSRTDASAAGASLPRRCNVDDDEVAARGFLANRLGRHANLQARCVAGAARDLRRLRNSGRWFEGRSADACWRGLARKLYPEIGDAGVVDCSERRWTLCRSGKRLTGVLLQFLRRPQAR